MNQPGLEDYLGRGFSSRAHTLFQVHLLPACTGPDRGSPPLSSHTHFREMGDSSLEGRSLVTAPCFSPICSTER